MDEHSDVYQMKLKVRPSQLIYVYVERIEWGFIRICAIDHFVRTGPLRNFNNIGLDQLIAEVANSFVMYDERSYIH